MPDKPVTGYYPTPARGGSARKILLKYRHNAYIEEIYKNYFKPMNLSLHLHPRNPMAVQTVREMLVIAGELGIHIHLSKRVLSAFQDDADRKSVTVHETDRATMEAGDAVAAVGGDGTMLSAAGLARPIQRPLLGINSGKLGFLANIQRQDLSVALHDVASGNYELDTRNFIEAEFSNGEIHYALNEFVFSRHGSVSMITLSAEYDGEFINRYWADGVIVSSPTGSTAYNLSTGGPIVVPQTDVMVLTPISPHTLTTRPLVLPCEKDLTIRVDPADQKVLFSGDGNNHDLPAVSPEVKIRKSASIMQLIKLSGQSYFETLRNKLMWGADVRELK